MEDEWTETRKRRGKQISRTGDHTKWRHAKVTTMFMSNFPLVARKYILKKFFEQFREVVDVYMAMKVGVNKKAFAFVRFKKIGDEQELEKSLQGVKYGDRTLEVNIERF